MKTFFSYLDANVWKIYEKNKYTSSKIIIKNIKKSALLYGLRKTEWF